MKIILTFPSFEFTLNVTKIPPLDIFYSPQHKAIFKRGRNKRKLYQSQGLVPGEVSSFEVLWKGSSAAPTKEFEKLT